jgi:hypothetical protein
MARSRFQPKPSRPSRLRRLRLYYARLFPPEDLLDELKMMEDEGFDVVVLSRLSPELMKDICLF